MGKLYEICSTKNCYKHTPLTEFGKIYYGNNDLSKIICEECRNAWLTEVSTDIANAIDNINKSFKPHRVQSSIKPSRYNNMSIDITICSGKYMTKLLPILFKISISKTSFQSEEEVEPGVFKTHCGDFEINTLENNDFSFFGNLYTDDNSESLIPFIKSYLTQYVNSKFTQIPPETVQILMDAANIPNYNSGNCGCTSNGRLCNKCQIPCSTEYYIMNNEIYCLDCMYAYVIEMVVSHNISPEDIGIAIENPPCDSTVFNIYNTTQWKRATIDKYINYMHGIGIKVDITHCTMNCT